MEFQLTNATKSLAANEVSRRRCFRFLTLLSPFLKAIIAAAFPMIPIAYTTLKIIPKVLVSGLMWVTCMWLAFTFVALWIMSCIVDGDIVDTTSILMCFLSSCYKCIGRLSRIGISSRILWMCECFGIIQSRRDLLEQKRLILLMFCIAKRIQITINIRRIFNIPLHRDNTRIKEILFVMITYCLIKIWLQNLLKNQSTNKRIAEGWRELPPEFQFTPMCNKQKQKLLRCAFFFLNYSHNTTQFYYVM